MYVPAFLASGADMAFFGPEGKDSVIALSAAGEGPNLQDRSQRIVAVSSQLNKDVMGTHHTRGIPGRSPSTEKRVSSVLLWRLVGALHLSCCR